MKIAVVSFHASPLAVFGGEGAGSQNVHVNELSAAMARRGHEVIVYTRRDDPSSPERVRAPQGYTVVHVPAGPPTRLLSDQIPEHINAFAQYLDEQWATERPDVAHGHFWMSGIATQLAARAHSVPTVQTFHSLGAAGSGEDGDATPTARMKLEKLVAKHATWVAAMCTDEVSDLVRMGRPRGRISVVPFGIDLNEFSTEGSAFDGGATHRIVAVGRLLPGKGFETMIKALPVIHDAEYVVVGGPDRERLPSDPEVRRLRALAGSIGVADRVKFTGALPRDQMPAILRSADVVTCTPRDEPSGIGALEAMACGVPVVASAVGGLVDAVVHDVTGRLVAPDSPRECAEAVSMMLRDSFLRRGLGLAGRDRACARYSWDTVAADTLRDYDGVARSRTAPDAARSPG
ncbi:glycosyltransferase [Mycolicibacterium sp. Dal123E01]|uniref:glycosyltransferase n=1 Tax=Mycolicibacterium sp. Dal123E01 TaxID=3457578 RepID=UPI00403E8484